ncbi:MAG: asparagine synthase-related protein [Waterburya sp.]
MAEQLSHRGPDNLSFVVRYNTGFAHTRLSILDVSSAGHQPMYNERYILCYNGEIYNYLELKKELLKSGVDFQSSSDTEVLFHYLIQRGISQTLRAIRGMFAFSFYDYETKKLYLCRDRLGIKPLNWILTSKGLFWASEVKSLQEVLPIEPDPIRTLTSIASTGEMSAENTVFKDVRQVRPGTYLQYEVGKTPEIHQYFDLIELIDQDYYHELNKCDEETVLKTLNDLLDGSIESMLMSDVPIGAFASGGIDSSLISVFAKKHREDFNLFTANVLGPFSEYSAVQCLSALTGASLHAYDFASEMFIRDWTETTYYYECPIITFGNAIPYSQTSKGLDA